MKRVLQVEWTDDAHTQIEARLAVRDETSTHALTVVVPVDLTTGLIGQATLHRCTADPSGETCLVLGGLSTHLDVTLTYHDPALTAFGQDGQEGLYVYLEGAL